MQSSRTELEFKVGVALTKGITTEIARAIADRGLDLKEYFTLPAFKLAEKLGANVKGMIQLSDREEALMKARREVDFMERHRIRFLYITDDNYPYRLAECTDAPVGLFVLGDCDLDAAYTLSVVGTRRTTIYGDAAANKIVEDLSVYFPELAVVSGLAYGVDACAHRAAIKHGLATIAVVAHGLDMIYPAQHRDLAGKIISSGGAIVSEYPSGTKAFRSNFLERNRIVAGLADATIVVESDIKGGAMSTANMAFSYGRDVLAVPGRIGDTMSSGCNRLIATQKAALITGAADVIENLNWQPLGLRIDVKQRNLFPELDPDSKIVLEALSAKGAPMSADELLTSTTIPISALISVLSEMEFEGIVVKLPGNRYQPAL